MSEFEDEVRRRLDALERAVFGGRPAREEGGARSADPRVEPGPRDSQPVARVRPRRGSAPVLAAAVEGQLELEQARRHLDRAGEALDRAADAAVRGDEGT